MDLLKKILNTLPQNEIASDNHKSIFPTQVEVTLLCTLDTTINCMNSLHLPTAHVRMTMTMIDQSFFYTKSNY